MGRKKEEAPPAPEQATRTKLDDHELASAMEDYQGYVNARALSIWDATHTGHQLTMEEQLFVRSYVIDRNPVAAFHRIGSLGAVATLKARAAKLLSKPEVKDAIDELASQMMAKLSITAERVQERIAEIAFFDPRSVMEFDGLGIHLLHSKFWNSGDAANISSIKMGNNGIEIKFYDRLKATEMLAKQLGMQPEDTNLADLLKHAAQSGMEKLVSYLDRTIPDDQGLPKAYNPELNALLPASEQVIDGN